MNRIIAAIIFFTRIPLWRWFQPSRESYQHVVEYWPFVGWITALVMGGTMFIASLVFPWTIAIIMGFVARLLLTGALHEDGLADFCDAFGAGGDRQRTLDIMKDSHIGTYGVLSLIIYYLSLFLIFTYLSPLEALLLIIAGDPYAKMLSAQIIQMLPYARTEQQAKSRTVYTRMTTKSAIILFIQALIPVICSYLLLQYFHLFHYNTQWMLFLPCFVMYILYRMMHNRLQGYTGDCCGAMFLLVEISFYLSALI